MKHASFNQNYYTYCKNCGKMSLTATSKAEYCPDPPPGEEKTNCRAKFHANGKVSSHNPTVTNCFGEDIDVDAALARFYFFYEQGPAEWTTPISYKYLFLFYEYYGPVPQGTETMIVGKYAAKKVSMSGTCKTGFIFKLAVHLSKEERNCNRHTWVKPKAAPFYSSLQDHPFGNQLLSLIELDEIVSRMEEVLNGKLGRRGEKPDDEELNPQAPE